MSSKINKDSYEQGKKFISFDSETEKSINIDYDLTVQSQSQT